MGQYTSYWLYQKYEKRGDQDWLPTYPNVWSVDGDGSMPLIKKLDNDQACGYDPQPEAQYRWVNMNPSFDYYCEECPVDPEVKIYRWNKAPASDYACSGTTKMYKEYYQYSTDGGVTWQNVIPVSSRTSDTVIEYNSEDCGYTPTGTTIYRWVETESTGCFELPKWEGYYYFTSDYRHDLLIHEHSCDGDDTLKCGDIPEEILDEHYYPYQIEKVIIGDCVKVLDHTFCYQHIPIIEVELGNNVEIIKNAAFSDTLISEIIMPDSVLEIGDGVKFRDDTCNCIGVFRGCKKLSYVKLSNNLIKIGTYAFSGCTSLRNIVIPNSVTEIGSFAFSDCHNLEAITLSNNITRLDDFVFEGCHSITGLTIPNSVTSIGDGTFRGCTGLTSITIPDSVIEIGSSVFEDCTSLTSATIGSGVTSIGWWAFKGCTELTSITIPDSVTEMRGYTFENCINLASVSLGDGLTIMDYGVFHNCTNLTNITIPDSVTEIGPEDFNNCTSLTSVTIGTGITSFGYSAFTNCTSLLNITINAIEPPASGTDMFKNTNNCPIYVPAESVEAYKTAFRWGEYANRIQAIQ